LDRGGTRRTVGDKAVDGEAALSVTQLKLLWRGGRRGTCWERRNEKTRGDALTGGGLERGAANRRKNKVGRATRG